MTLVEEITYVVVYHHHYAPDGYRVYSSQDEYLSQYPSMYTIVQEGLLQDEANALCEHLNESALDDYYQENQ